MEQRLSAEENDIVIRGFTQSKLRTVLSGVVIALSGGLAALLFYWFPKLRLYGTCVKCPLETATKVLVEEIYQKQHKSFFIKNIKLSSIDKGTENVAYQHESTRTSTIRKISRNGVASEAFEIHFEDGYKMQDVEEYRHFESKKCTYIWDERFGKFNRLAGLDVGTTCAQLHAKAARLPSSDRQRKMIAVYGSNDIIVPVKSVFQLFVLEFFNPFYMFQLFTIGVWIAEAYYYYCIAIVIMTTFGITTSIIQTRRNQTKLRNTLEGTEMVTLLTGSGPQQVESSSLAPGDVILLPPGGCKVPADAALLCGSCVVNEGMLTGESVPVAKTAMPMTDETFNLREHAMHIIYCGTQVIQTRYYEGEYVRALILKTGYLTTKGQLVRSILYPLPADFKFDRDSYKFIIILTVIAFLGLTYTVVLKSARQMTAGDVILKSLDILTIVIPPALPAAMTVGRLYAVSRLKMANIFCMNTRAINVCGSVNLLCFDKTGTLTEDGLDMWGVIPMESPKKYKDSPPDGYVSDTNHNSTTRLGIPNKDPGTLDEDDDLKIGMNVCHNLTILNGELSGDPLELIMFQSTGWILEEPTVPDTTKFDLLMPTIVRPSQPYQIAYGDDFLPLEVGVVHQYPFSSSLQRSCVIAKVLGDKNFRAYCKGAPEMISSLCKPSTIPTDLNEELVRYAKKGYRVIAMASKSLGVESITKMQRLTRDEVEKDLTFLGLIIMENKLKPVTTQVITELKHANIRIVMITGDNIHTAQSVALDCGILSPNDTIVEVKIEPDHYGREIVKFYSVLSEIPAQNGNHYYIHTKDSIKDLELGITRNIRFVMSGPTWKSLREISPQTIPDIIVRGAVFARMTSDQKQQLVMEYQKLGYYVAMCGDGANDCGALRAAHTGISLSQHESSVAAPFTSSTQDISCIPVVIREGRAALTTSFGCFKFIVAYSLTQFFSVALLYYSDSNLTDLQFLYIDLVLIIVFAFMFGNTKAYAGKLYRKPPPNALLGFVPLLSLGFQLAIIGTFQVLSYFILTRYDWYEKHVSPTEISYQCWENYAVFSVSMFQYIALAICFSHGYPFRKSLLTNIPMMVYIVVITIVCAYIVMTPAEWLRNLLELEMPIGYQFRCIILVLASINFAICIAFERITIQYLLQIRNYLPNFLIKRSIKQTPYLALTDKSVSKEFPIIDANKSCELILKNGISHAVDMANHEKTTNGL